MHKTLKNESTWGTSQKMTENASVSRQYLNQIRHYPCTLNKGSKKNTGHLTPCWIREAQLYEKARVLGQTLHCSKCWYAYGPSRGKILSPQARLLLQAPAWLCVLISLRLTAHPGDIKGGSPGEEAFSNRKPRVGSCTV